MVPHGGSEGASQPAAAADGWKRDAPQRAPRATHKASSVHERARFVRQNMHHNGLSDKRARDWTVSDGVLDEGEEEAMFQGHAAWVDETRPGGEWRMALAVALCWLVAWSDSILGSAWAYGQLRRLGVELAPKVADALPAAGSTLVVGRRAVVRAAHEAYAAAQEMLVAAHAARA